MSFNQRGKRSDSPIDSNRVFFSSLKESYLAAVKEAESAGLPQRAIDSSNKGNRMLQKMGWREGTGLGKTNQGRTNIIEVIITRNRIKAISYSHRRPAILEKGRKRISCKIPIVI